MNVLLEQLEDFNARLIACGARYALIGGLSAHQLPRATQDIDFLLNRLDADWFPESAPSRFAGLCRCTHSKPFAKSETGAANACTAPAKGALLSL